MKKNYTKGLVLALLSGLSLASYAQCPTIPAPTISGATLAPCTTSSTFTLTASSSTNTTYWFSAANANLVSTGSVYVTPVITSSAMYYAAQGSGAAISASIGLPAYSSPYSGNTRGIAFQSPTQLVITGIRVPTDIGSGNSSFAVMLFPPGGLQNYPTTTNTYTMLASVTNTPGTAIIPVNIAVNNGDMIGILGCRDVSGTPNTSYSGASSPYASTLGTYALNVLRFGMQYPLPSTTPQDLWTESGGTVPRIEVYTSIGCLSQMVPVTVTVTGAPQINIAAPSSSICANSSFTLNASGVSNYTWTGGPQTSSMVINPGVTTSYTVFGALPAVAPTCTNTAVVTVSVNTAVPSLSVIASSASVCLGGTLSLSAQGAATYTLSTGLPNGSVFSPTATVTYSISGTNGCGSSSTTTTIPVAPLPVVIAPSSTLVCASTPATLQASGASNFTWSPYASYNSSIIPTPSVNTVYTVNGTTGPCVGSTTIMISTKPNPTLNISATTSMVCAGDNVNLTVSGNAVTYTWNPTGQQGTTLNDTPGNSTLYTVLGTNAVNCVSAAQQVILVNPLPVVTAAVSNPLICSTDPSTLSASGASTYVWTGGNGSTSSMMVVNPVTDATYTVVGTSSLNCSNSAVVTVNVFAPTIIVSSNTAVCIGSNASIGAGTADSYQWSSGQVSQNITVSPTLTTVYTVTAMVNNLNGLACPTTNTVEVTVNPTPSVGATSNHSIICFGNTAILTATGAVTYTWTGGSGATTNATLLAAPIADQGYTVTGTDANGCKGKGTYLLVVSACTGIQENHLNTANLSVYPNPNNGEFVISSNTAITLQITNELGQMMKEITLSQQNTQVNVGDLANGVYFITGQNAEGSVKQKIVINK